MKTTWFLLALLFFLPVHVCAADANVLPKGNFAFHAEYTHYNSWDKRYNKDGHVEDAASDFNAVLDSSIFPDLAMFDEFVAGIPNIGTTDVTFDYDYKRIESTIAYGVTDNLSVGVKIPYIWYKNKVTAKVDTTNANLGKNNLFGLGVLPPTYDSLPLLPIGTPGLPPGAITPISTEDVQGLLGDGLDINGIQAIPGYGFERFETWDENGLGDIEAGAKYRYYQSDNWRLAGLLGVLLPTGEANDPDNLTSQQLGCDTYALIFRSYNDYTGIENMTINGSVYYNWTLSYDDERRIVSSPREPLSAIKEDVDIDPGDVLEVETSIKYQFDDQSSLSGFSGELLYHYNKYFKDEVSGPGSNKRYDGLEEESDGEEHIYKVSIGYSTIPLFLKKEFPLPLDVSLTYRNKFDGNNSAFKTEYTQLGLTLYF